MTRRTVVAFTLVVVAALGVGAFFVAMVAYRFRSESVAIKELGSSDAETCRSAVERLAALRSVKALPYLVEAARMWRVDADVVQRAVVEITGGAPQGPDSPFTEQLVLWLADSKRAAGAPAFLGALGRAALPAVERALDRDAAAARGIESLRWMSPLPQAAMELVGRALQHDRVEARRAALSVISSRAEIGQRFVPSVSALLRDKRSLVRHDAALVLVEIGALRAGLASFFASQADVGESAFVDVMRMLARTDPETSRALASLLDAEDVTTRARAAWGLAVMHKEGLPVEPAVGRALHGALVDGSALVRWTALRSLGQLRERIRLDTGRLLALLADPEHMVRQRAAALAVLSSAESPPPGIPDVAPVLLGSLQSPEPDLRELASEALAAVAPRREDVLSNLIDLCGRGTVEGRCAALATLRRLGPAAERALPQLRRALLSGEPAVEVAAVDALARIGPRVSEAAAELVQLLARWQFEFDAPRGLVTLFPGGAVESKQTLALADALLSFRDELSSRDSLVDLLASLGDAAVPHLSLVLDGDSSEPSRRALLVLASFEKPSASGRAVLERVLSSTRDGELQQIALLTLCSRHVDWNGIEPERRDELVAALRDVVVDASPSSLALLAAARLAAVEGALDARARDVLVDAILNSEETVYVGLAAVLRAVEAGFRDEGITSAVRQRARNAPKGAAVYLRAEQILDVIEGEAE